MAPRIATLAVVFSLGFNAAWASPPPVRPRPAPRTSARQAETRAALGSLSTLLASSPKLDPSIKGETYQATMSVVTALSRLPHRQLVSMARQLGIQKTINLEAPSYLIASNIVDYGHAYFGPSLVPRLQQAALEVSQGKVARPRPQVALKEAIRVAGQLTEITYDFDKPAAREATLALRAALAQLSQPQLRQVARQLGVQTDINLHYYSEHLGFEIMETSKRHFGQSAVSRLQQALADVSHGNTVRRDPKGALQAAVRVAEGLTELSFEPSKPAAREVTLALARAMGQLTQGQLEQLARKLGIQADVDLTAPSMNLAYRMTSVSQNRTEGASRLKQALLDLWQGRAARLDPRQALRETARVADRLTELTYDSSKPAAREATWAFTRALEELSIEQLRLLSRRLGIHPFVNFGSSTNEAAASLTREVSRYHGTTAVAALKEVLRSTLAAADPSSR
jgi:hypothetical protein